MQHSLLPSSACHYVSWRGETLVTYSTRLSSSYFPCLSPFPIDLPFILKPLPLLKGLTDWRDDSLPNSWRKGSDNAPKKTTGNKKAYKKTWNKKKSPEGEKKVPLLPLYLLLPFSLLLTFFLFFFPDFHPRRYSLSPVSLSNVFSFIHPK